MEGELHDLYQSHWPGVYKILAAVPHGRRVSCPFLLTVQAPISYLGAQRKLMIVGQQTDGWTGLGDIADAGDPISVVMAESRRPPTLGAALPGSPFWRAAHTLYWAANANGPKNGFLWNNLIKFDEQLSTQGGRPRYGPPRPDLDEPLFAAFNVTLEEIRITRPEAIVFFTAAEPYRTRMHRIFPGLRLSPTAERLVYQASHRDLPDRSYVTYHPGWLNRSPARGSPTRWHVIDWLCRAIA
jgi:hypothetical protein